MISEDIDAYVKTIRCPKCYKRIAQYSYEGDYICEKHGFVSPITDDDVREQIAAIAEVIAEN